MEEIAYSYWPRIDFGPGPWADEADHVQFEHAGLPCLAVRHPEDGNWCGYAGVPPGHPLHGFDCGDDQLSGAPSHFHLNYSAPCQGLICHVPQPGEEEPTWWFGMDFNHAFDFAPGPELRLRGILDRAPADDQNANWLRSYRRSAEALHNPFRGVYRDLDFVKDVVRTLAEWLAARSVDNKMAESCQ